MRDLRWSALVVPFAFAACADSGPTTGIDVSFTPGVASGALNGMRITSLQVNLDAVTMTSSVREQSRLFDTKGTYLVDLLNPADSKLPTFELEAGTRWDGIVLQSPGAIETHDGALLGLFDNDDDDDGDDGGGLDIDLDLSLSIGQDDEGHTDIDLGLGLGVTASDDEGNSASLGATAGVNISDDGIDADADASGDATDSDGDFVAGLDLGIAANASEDGLDIDAASHGNVMYTDDGRELGGHWAFDADGHLTEDGVDFDADGDAAVGYADEDGSTTIEVSGAASGAADEDGADFAANADASAQHHDSDGHDWAVDAAVNAAGHADEDGASGNLGAVGHYAYDGGEGALAVNMQGYFGEDRFELQIISFGSIRLRGDDTTVDPGQTSDFVIDFHVAKWFENIDMNDLERDDEGVIRIDFDHNGAAYDDIVQNLIDAITFDHDD